MSKQKRVKLIVELPQPDGVTMAELKAYVKAGIESGIGMRDKGDPMFGTFRGTTKVYSPRRKEPKVKK